MEWDAEGGEDRRGKEEEEEEVEEGRKEPSTVGERKGSPQR